jgi:hypothetical protein
MLAEISESTVPVVDISNVACIAKELIGFVVNRYGVKSYDEFTCPIHKRMAQELKWFELGPGEPK